jgi:hypothetical protein
MEDFEALGQKAHEAAEAMARRQKRDTTDVLEDALGVSPQYGFSSVSSGGAPDITEDRMAEKLLLLKKLAERVRP